MQRPLHKWREQDNYILMYGQPNGQWLKSIKFKLPIIEEDIEMSLDDDKHVETVVLLSKGEINSKKLRVEFSLADMDMSGFQKGATCVQRHALRAAGKRRGY